MIITHVTRVFFVVDYWFLVKERLVRSSSRHFFEVGNVTFNLRLNID